MKNSSGAVLPGATVTAVNVVQAATYTAQTTAQGAFVLAQVPPGTNVVSVELQGFKKVEKRRRAQHRDDGERRRVRARHRKRHRDRDRAGRRRPAILKTESAERSDLVTNTQLRELALSYCQPIHDRERRLGFFNPDLFDPARAVRLYRPVCIGSPCVARAVNPGTTSAPTLESTRPASYVGTIVPGSGDLTNGIGRVADGYPAGAMETPAVLWGPRAGFSWNLGAASKTIVRGGFGISYDPDTDRVADAITNPPGIQVVTLSNGSLASFETATRSDILPVFGDVVGMPRDSRVPRCSTCSTSCSTRRGTWRPT